MVLAIDTVGHDLLHLQTFNFYEHPPSMAVSQRLRSRWPGTGWCPRQGSSAAALNQRWDTGYGSRRVHDGLPRYSALPDGMGITRRCKCPVYQRIALYALTSRADTLKFENGRYEHQSSKRVHDREPVLECS
jgi:hypothetical protein